MRRARAPDMHHAATSESVQVPVLGGRVGGDLEWPLSPTGLVLFAQGRRGSRASPGERALAGALHDAQIATFVADLLTPQAEAIDARVGLRADIAILAEQLTGLIDWLKGDARLERLPLGLFGAGAGAAAALVAAARRHAAIRAVVAPEGRPDLARDHLREVKAPTLLIVGARDHEGVRLNADAARVLGRSARVESIEGATHLFDEPGALEDVARLAADWFALHFAAGRAAIHATPP